MISRKATHEADRQKLLSRKKFAGGLNMAFDAGDDETRRGKAIEGLAWLALQIVAERRMGQHLELRAPAAAQKPLRGDLRLETPSLNARVDLAAFRSSSPS